MEAAPLKPDAAIGPVQNWRRELSALTRLAIPIVGVQLGLMLMGTCDMMMVGRVSAAALNGIFFGNLYSMGLLIFGMGVMMVLDPLVSQAHGAGDPARISQAFYRSIVLSFLLSAPFAVLFLNAHGILLWLSGGQEEATAIADQFVRWSTPGIPAWFLFIALRQTLQGMSIVRPLLITVVIANVVNAVLNYGFIYGEWGMPALGAPGTGVATTIGRWAMVVLLAAFAAPALGRVCRRPDRTLLDLRPYGTMLVKGLQIGIQVALEVWVFQLVAVLVIRMGVVEGAAQAPVYNLVSLSFMIPLGVGGAAAARVGNALGRGDGKAARLTAFVALALGAAVMIGSGLMFSLFPEPFLRLYGVESDVLALAAVLLPIGGLFQIFDGTQAVGCGILRGAGDTKVAAIINLLGYWVVGLPIGMLLTYRFDAGPAGLWWGLTLALAVVAVLLVLRIRRALGRATAQTEWVLAKEDE